MCKEIDTKWVEHYLILFRINQTFNRINVFISFNWHIFSFLLKLLFWRLKHHKHLYIHLYISRKKWGPYVSVCEELQSGVQIRINTHQTKENGRFIIMGQNLMPQTQLMIGFFPCMLRQTLFSLCLNLLLL